MNNEEERRREREREREDEQNLPKYERNVEELFCTYELFKYHRRIKILTLLQQSKIL
jgi:hypothetical protein